MVTAFLFKLEKRSKMNYGRMDNRRADVSKKQQRAGGMNLKSAAKQMGLNPSEMGQDASNIWNMLEELSTSDPEAYKDFIQTQMAAANTAKSSSAGQFTPQIAAHVIKTTGNKLNGLL